MDPMVDLPEVDLSGLSDLMDIDIELPALASDLSGGGSKSLARPRAAASPTVPAPISRRRVTVTIRVPSDVIEGSRVSLPPKVHATRPS